MKLIHILAAITILLSIACKKNLEQYPKGTLTEKDVFTEAGDFVLATDAIYIPLCNRQRGNWDWDEGGSIPREWVVGDVMSDDAVKGGGGLGDQEDMRKMQTFNITPSNNNVLGIWRYNYIGISAANLVLTQKIDNVKDLTTDLYNRVKGEALFLRAFYYFRLVTNFGAVPLLVPEKGLTDNTRRTSTDSVYKQIEEDLISAQSLLPSEYTGADYYRATKGAATALLAKTYLYCRQYQECLNTIAQLKGYSLLPVFASNFNGVEEKGVETIFAARHELGAVPQQGSVLNAVFAPSGWGWGFNIPTKDLVNEFEQGDPRRAATLFMKGDNWLNNKPYDTSLSGTASPITHMNVRKFMSLSSPLEDGGIDFIYIRYADVLLWKAECHAMLGQLADAKAALETVRARARNNSSDPSVLPKVTADNQQSVIKAIQHERRVELAFECHRYYDMVRWDIAKDILVKDPSADPLTGYKDYGEGWKSYQKLLPIPQREVDLLGLPQNEGYYN